MKKNSTFMRLCMALLLAVLTTAVRADVVPFTESYNAESTTDGWTSSVEGRFTPIIYNEADLQQGASDNYFLSVNQSELSNNGCLVTGTVLSGKAAAGDDFTLEFDMRLCNSNNNVNSQFPVSLQIKDADNDKDILSLSTPSKYVQTWIVNGTDLQVTLPGYGGQTISALTWCHYVIARSGNLTYLTITNNATDETILERTLIGGSSEKGGLGNIVFTTKRYRSNFAIDNIVVRQLQEGDVPSVEMSSYTIKYHNESGDEIAADIVTPYIVGGEATANDGQLAPIYYNDKKYLYKEGNSTITLVGDAAQNVITLVYCEAQKCSYTVIGKYGDKEKVLHEGTGYEGDIVTYNYPEYILDGTTLYFKQTKTTNPHFGGTILLNEANITEYVYYTDGEASNVVYYKEAEQMDGFTPLATNNADIRCSDGKGGVIDGDEPVVLTTLPAGTYTIHGQIWGTAGYTATITAGDKTVWELTSVGWIIDATSDIFTLDEETTLYIKDSGDLEDKKMLDLIYIQEAKPQYVAEFNRVEETLTFKKGTLSLGAATTWDAENTGSQPGWYSQRTNVKTVIFDESFADARPTSCAQWFKGATTLTTITGLEYLNTSEVTSMAEMFSGCRSLASLDISSFNTSNVTDMHWMFDGCTSLISLDVSNFNTSNVTNMSGMFWACSSLVSLVVSNFNTSKVTSMNSMFSGCWSLTSLDVSNFNTLNVKNMGFMFRECISLSSLDVSNFNTTNVTFMSGMFESCQSLSSLDVSKFNTDNVTEVSAMFAECHSLTSLDISKFNTSNVTDMSSMFYGCSSLTSLDVSNFNTSNVTGMAGLFGNCSSLTSLDVSSFNTSNVTTMYQMFEECISLSSLDVSSFNTSNVTNMSRMFYGCSSLKTIYAGDGWITDAVTESYSMYYNCTALVGGKGTTYNAEHADAEYARIDGGTDAPGYFTGKNATPVVNPEAYAVLSDDGQTVTFYYDTQKANRTRVVEINQNYISTHYGGVNAYGTATTAVFDTSFADYHPTSTAFWFMDCRKLTSISGIEYLNTSNVMSMSGMFLGCSSLTSLDVSNFNTSNVTEMGSMFSGCSSLTSLDVSSFTTDNVTYMGNMFDGCSSLKSLDVSKFNTDNVTYVGAMFAECHSLTSLDVSNFNTGKVTHMGAMFLNCSSLSSLDVSDFNTSNVTSMMDMFAGCSSLTSLDVCNFNTDKVTNMRGMYSGCGSLASLDISNFNTSRVTDMNYMFVNCSSLNTIYVGDGWTTDAIASDTYMFYCTALVGGAGTTFDANHTDIEYARIDGGADAPGYFTDKNATPFVKPEAYAVLSEDGQTVTFYYDTQKANRTGVVEINRNKIIGQEQSNAYGTATTAVIDASFADYRPTSTAYWFMGCSLLVSISGMENLNTSDVTSMYDMFNNCSSLASLDVGNLKTDKVWDMDLMFSGCSSLTSLDVSNFNTSKVTNMFGMFWGCSSLTSLNVSLFDTYNVRGMGNMFFDCSSLTSLDVSNFNTSNVTDMDNMFNGCSSLTSLDVSNFNTSNVTDMSAMFGNCSSLPSLDLSYLNTSNVTDMSYMFYKCNSLTSLDLSNFNTSNVTRMDDMFSGCSSLTSLDVSSFNTSNVTTTYEMFFGCSSLTSLDVSNFNTSNVTNMRWMFGSCSSLTSLDVSNFNTSNVTDMSAMFGGCSSLISLDVSNFHTSNVTNMSYMFGSCSALTSLNLSNFNTYNVTNMGTMFIDCSSMSTLDFCYFNTSNVTNMFGMFARCSSMKTIYVGDGWSTDAVSNSSGMFETCTALVGGAGTVYDPKHMKAEYARIDMPSQPGYFTYKTQKGTSITLNVYDDEGKEITNGANIVWYDVNGKQTGTGNTLSGVGEDAEIYYSMLLDETLGRVYREVNMQKVEINKEGVVTCQLEKIGRVTLEGRVSATDIDKTTATVNVRQMLNGKWQQDYSTRTDAQGRFSIEVYDDTTDVTISGDGYLDVSLHRNGFKGDGNMGTIPMNLLTGFAVTANITMKESATSGEIAEVNVWDGNLNNIDFSLTNTTKGMAIEDIAVQNGNVIIKSGADVGDEISLTAKSKQRVFADATTSFVLSDGANSFDLQLTELGGIDATCAATNNGTTVGYLYDSNGSLAARGSYRGETLSLRHLPNGNYTLVSMGQSLLLGSMTKLSALNDTGLSEGTDYVTTVVNVIDGALTTASVSAVPKMNDERFYHTADNTYFNADKSMVIAGNYIQLSAHVDFKPEYADKIDDVTLTIELPEGCQMLENTVIANRQSVPYTLNGNIITIPLTKEQYESTVKFCVVPTLNKDYTVTAMASFNINGQKQQPIGAAQFEAKGLSLNAPKMTASTIITVTGTAKGRSEVSIYDNDVLIGKATSKSDGLWSAECELFKPFNLSFHDIYAKITTENGLELTSETQQVEYNKTSIVPQKVTMLYYNPEFSKNYNIVFDLVNGTTTPSNYYYFPYKNWPNWYQTRETEPKAFTFLADFTLNDPSRVKNVNIKVLNSDGTVRTLPATFDDKQGKWVATTKYSSSSRLPQNVTVEYDVIPVFFSDEEREESILDQSTVMTNIANQIYQYMQNNAEINMISDSEKSVLTELNVGAETPYLYSIVELEYADVMRMMSEKQFIYSTTEVGGIGTYTESYDDSISVICVDLGQEYAFRVTLSGSDANKTMGSKGVTTVNDMAINTFMSSLTNGRFLNDFGEVGGAIGDILGLTGYLSVRNDFNNMCDLIIRYEDTYDEIRKNTLQKMIAKCPDGSLMLSNAQITQFNNRLFSIDNRRTEFSEAYFKFLEEYKKRLRNSVITDMATLGLGKILGVASKSAKFINSKANQWFVKYLSSKTTAETSAGILTNCIGTALGQVVEGVDKVFQYKDFTDSRDYIMEWAPEQNFEICQEYIKLKQDIRDSYKKCEKDKEENGDEPNDKKTDDKSDFKGKGTTPIHDPSGYVYEAVLSNRLPGVTTTVYEQVNGVAVKWNAEEYSQVNPLLTDETGFYRWDVPQGMWQVKYEKDGYETTYSEWLPVPPPQLDVNICMKQSTPPTVKQMRGYETGITVEMAKYMMPETMTAQNITVTRNGEVESGSIEMVNAEKAPLGEETYVSKVRFVPESNFNPSDVVVVTIHKEVESYCGAQMTADHVETVKIESEVKGIVVDDAVTIPYQGERELRIVVLPKEASAGKTLRVSTSSQMIASINTSEAVIDEDGAVNLTIGGELPGGAVLDFAVEGTDVTATTKVQVVVGGDIVETPTASISSGETIVSGTKLTLSCTTSGATIYYTLDGSCPCDEATRILYNGPIAITKDVTVKAMAVKDGMEDSDVATFVYTVEYEQVKTPQASIASTETVMSGQTLELTCATDGATIYYTLDGSSPTDESARMKYSSPIVLTEDVTVKAIAVKDGMDNSDVATFVYTVTGIKDVVTDRIEEDTPIYNVSGQRLNKTRKGINIIGGRKFSVK